MRLWSIHPKYLDSIGLIALWREALLAKAVLELNTKGYKNHPQLIRFKKSKTPLKSINTFLANVLKEALERNYNFDKNKIDSKLKHKEKIDVTNRQLEYEFQHLLKKLKTRDPKKHNALKKIKIIECNPLFCIIEGPIEKWEKLK